MIRLVVHDIVRQGAMIIYSGGEGRRRGNRWIWEIERTSGGEIWCYTLLYAKRLRERGEASRIMTIALAGRS